MVVIGVQALCQRRELLILAVAVAVVQGQVVLELLALLVGLVLSLFVT
jgi:hypothetical protein